MLNNTAKTLAIDTAANRLNLYKGKPLLLCDVTIWPHLGHEASCLTNVLKSSMFSRGGTPKVHLKPGNERS